MTIEDDVRVLAPKLLAEAEATAAGLSLRTKVEILVAVLVVTGVTLWGLTRDPAPAPEVVTAAPAVVQADGSQIVQRAPDAHPPAPPHLLPKGAVEMRREKIVAAPAAGASSVEVDLSLVRIDGGQRVIASSPDGTINQAIDIPIEPAMLLAPAKPWAAGLSYSTEREVGVWLERDLGRLRLGAEVAKGAGKPRAELRVGVSF